MNEPMTPGQEVVPEDVPALLARVAELEAQRDRRRVRLVALQSDALAMRGALSPSGGARRVPFPLGDTLTPTVEWLIAEVARLRTELAARPTRAEVLRETADGMTASCPDHGSVDQHDMVCRCASADELRRVADAAEREAGS